MKSLVSPARRAVMLLLLTLIAQAGCSQSSTNLYDDYMGRLANVLSVPTTDWSTPPPVASPSSRDLRVTVPDMRVTPLAYWNLRHCRLFNLISERNSILGRIATPNNVWLYEARVLHAIEQCLIHTETDDEQITQLEGWRAEKQLTWPAATWNGTLAAPELRQLWRARSDGWAPGSIPSIATLSNDLGTLTTWVTQWSEPQPDQPIGVDSSTFSAVYQRIGQHSTAGEWRRSVQISTHGLAAANTQLRAAVEQNQLCPTGRPTRAANNAQNVLRLVYIGDIQPYIAELNRRGETLLGDLDALASAIDLEHDVWSTFFAQLQDELASLQHTSRQHADYWQALLDSCGLTAGGQ